MHSNITAAYHDSYFIMIVLAISSYSNSSIAVLYTNTTINSYQKSEYQYHVASCYGYYIVVPQPLYL